MFQKLVISIVMVFIPTAVALTLPWKDVEGSKDHPMISRYEGSTRLFLKMIGIIEF